MTLYLRYRVVASILVFILILGFWLAGKWNKDEPITVDEGLPSILYGRLVFVNNDQLYIYNLHNYNKMKVDTGKTISASDVYKILGYDIKDDAIVCMSSEYILERLCIDFGRGVVTGIHQNAKIRFDNPYYWMASNSRLFQISGYQDVLRMSYIATHGNSKILFTTNIPKNIAPKTEWYSRPAIYSDRIAFSIYDRHGNYRIVLTDMKKHDTHVLTSGANPAWSPNGQKIAFAPRDSAYDKVSIGIIDIDTKNISHLTLWKATTLREYLPFGKPSTITRIDWIPQSKYVVCSVSIWDEKYEEQIFVVDTETGRSSKLPIWVDPDKWIVIAEETRKDL